MPEGSSDRLTLSDALTSVNLGSIPVRPTSNRVGRGHSRLARLCGEMKLQERQYLFDNVARGPGVVEYVERVRPRRVVYDGHWQVDGQRGPNESVERVVEPRHFVPTCSRNQQREIAREIIAGFTGR